MTDSPHLPSSYHIIHSSVVIFAFLFDSTTRERDDRETETEREQDEQREREQEPGEKVNRKSSPQKSMLVIVLPTVFTVISLYSVIKCGFSPTSSYFYLHHRYCVCFIYDQITSIYFFSISIQYVYVLLSVQRGRGGDGEERGERRERRMERERRGEEDGEEMNQVRKWTGRQDHISHVSYCFPYSLGHQQWTSQWFYNSKKCNDVLSTNVDSPKPLLTYIYLPYKCSVCLLNLLSRYMLFGSSVIVMCYCQRGQEEDGEERVSRNNQVSQHCYCYIYYDVCGLHSEHHIFIKALS